jgi:hypothetical protein
MYIQVNVMDPCIISTFNNITWNCGFQFWLIQTQNHTLYLACTSDQLSKRFLRILLPLTSTTLSSKLFRIAIIQFVKKCSLSFFLRQVLNGGNQLHCSHVHFSNHKDTFFFVRTPYRNSIFKMWSKPHIKTKLRKWKNFKYFFFQQHYNCLISLLT